MTALCAGDGNCNGPAGRESGNQAVEGRFAGTRNCDHPVVISRSVSRFILICVPLAICAARLHSQGAGSPSGVTQDVNRCLTVVRLAASRRGHAGRGRAGLVRRPESQPSGLLVAYPPPSVCDIPA